MFRLQIDESLQLRLLEPHHAAEVFRAVDDNRLRLREWLPCVDATERVEDTRGFIEQALEKLAKQRELTAGIWEGDQFAGVLGVILDRQENSGELGYWLGSGFVGRGLATRSISALIPYLFGERGLARLEIRCAPQNTPSCAVAKRLGFRSEGVLPRAEKVGDRWLDHEVFVLWQSDWPDRGTSAPRSGGA